MGKLSDIVIPTEEVDLGNDQNLTFRGLSSRDVEIILSRHMNSLSRIFDQWFSANKSTMPTDMQFVETIVKEAPEVIPTLIVLGNDDTNSDFEDSIARAANLPVAVQYECVLAVIGLTITSVSALKKILHKITEGLNAAGVLMSETGTSITSDGSSNELSPPVKRKGTRKPKRIRSAA